MKKIIIDSREQGRKRMAMEYYEDKADNVVIDTLVVGDYVFDGSVVFEFKNMSDFFNSLSNKSVFQECSNQASKYTYHFLVIAGDVEKYLKKAYYSWGRRTGLPLYKFVSLNMKKFRGALCRLRTITNVIQVETDEQAFDEMLLQAEKCLDGKTKYYGGVVRPVESQDVVDVVLSGCKGVSMKKVQSIREYYELSGLGSLLMMSYDDLVAVPGIGAKTAEKIISYIGGDGE